MFKEPKEDMKGKYENNVSLITQRISIYIEIIYIYKTSLNKLVINIL